MDGLSEWATNLNLKITIPNKKSRSNMKYNVNYVKLSDYMDIDERLEIVLQKRTKIEEDHNEIIIQIQGLTTYIDHERFLYALRKLEDETESKWQGDFTISDRHGNASILFSSKDGFRGEDLDPLKDDETTIDYLF